MGMVLGYLQWDCDGGGWLQRVAKQGLWWLSLQQNQSRGREGEMRVFERETK